MRFAGRLQLYADRTLPSSVVWSLVERLKAAGFYRFSFVLRKSGSKDLIYCDFYAPRVEGCALCAESAVRLADVSVLIDLNTKLGHLESGQPLEWDDLPRSLHLLLDMDPTTSICIVIQDAGTYGELAHSVRFFNPAGQAYLSLLPPHHRLEAEELR